MNEILFSEAIFVLTPEDYEPPGFAASSELKFNFPQKTTNISLGKIDTDAHGCKLLLKTTFNKHVLPQIDIEDPLQSTDPDKKGPFVNADEQTVTQLSGLPEKEKLCEETKIKISMKCPCKCKLAEEHDVIACLNCKHLQHKTCYGILKPDENPSIFYCVGCATNVDYPLTDAIYTYQGKECQLDTNSLSLSTSHQESPSVLLDDSTMIELSVKKVRDMNLHDKSPAKGLTSRKRKASSEIVNLDNSEELFQSQKRMRVRKVMKKR